MKRALLLQEIRQMRFEEIYKTRTRKGLTMEEAAELLGMSERTFRRYVHRFNEEGPPGLADKRLGKAAHNTAPADEVAQLLELFETRYPSFSAAHFFDQYREYHEGQRSYSWVKEHLQTAGIVKTAKKRGAHRRKRPRKPMKGMMLHQDGSTHAWVSGAMWDLIITLDDADSEIYSGFFVEEEGTWSSFQGMREVILNHGLCCSFYVDRGSHYFTTIEKGKKVDKTRPTQFGRAMNQLGINFIAAYSPEARGRSERMFRTLQGRLPQELKLAGITDMEQANKYLRDTFIPAFNKRFKAKPEQPESAFVPWLNSNENLEDILCIQEQRIVKKDNTVSYKNKILQIPKNQYRYSYQKTTVMIHEYQNGQLAIFHGPRGIGNYDAEGQLITNKEDVNTNKLKQAV